MLRSAVNGGGIWSRQAAQAVLEATGVSASAVDSVCVGNVAQTSADTPYLAGDVTPDLARFSPYPASLHGRSSAACGTAPMVDGTAP
jgi:hypothetical protein